MQDVKPSTFEFPAGASAGQMLRALREHHGVEQEVLASSMKVPAQKIRALENDDWAALPAIFFARGLANNICRHFHVDAHPVLAAMPDDKPRIATDDESLNTPFSNAGFSSSLRSSLWQPWGIVGVGLLVLVALVLFLYPTLRAKFSSRSAASAASAVASAQAQAVAASTAASAAPVAAGNVLGTQLTPAPALPAASVAAPVASTAAAVSANTLRFNATADVWVQVRSSNGATLFERTLNAGQTESYDVAQYPVRVTVGRAENVTMQRGDQAFDLAAIAKTGVARFNLE